MTGDIVGGHPQNIAKYEILGVLGEGAMGVVYRARDPLIGRTVAIKTVRPELAGGALAGEMDSRFLREIRAVGNLRHPNIIAIFDSGEQAGSHYFVMEFVEGRELSELLQAGARFSLEQVLQIARQLLSALAYTHQRGIIHRDIKPANIFLTDEGDVKVADFGIARVEDSELTQMGSSLGTPSYMSPEQCAGQAVDGRSDLFSVAIVLYQLLTGEKPFYGESVHALMHRIINVNPEKPSRLNPALPPALDAVLERALAKRPDARFQSAGEFLQALEAVASGQAGQGATRRFWLPFGVSALVVYTLSLALFLVVLPAAPPAPSAAPAMPLISDADLGLDMAPAVVSLDAEQREKVERFLRLARISIDNGRLVWPPGSNAAYVYRLVLEIDPGNREARAGLREVLELQLQRARDLHASGERDVLAEHLQVSLDAFPEARELREMRRNLTLPAEQARGMP